MKDEDFGKPIIAVANSFTQFVPGHVHLKDLGQLVAREIERAGGVAKEFNTIAIDDGIAMGHGGMLYSLPSRELIADSVEYMVNAHCADALVCISNCDKITPGMMMAALRLNIPAIFISGGPMEAGKVTFKGKTVAVDLIDAMIKGADKSVSDEEALAYERESCPTCGSCSGMFTANSMNCLTEALGLALPGNGTLVATHADRKDLFLAAGKLIVALAKRYYEQGDESALPRSIANFAAFENAMTLDIAMGGSTNTVLHLLAAAEEGGVPFTMADIDRLSRRTPCLCKVAPSKNDVHLEDVHRAGGIMAILGELDRAGLINRECPTVHSATIADALNVWDVSRTDQPDVQQLYLAAPGGVRTTEAFSQAKRSDALDLDRAGGVIRSAGNAFSKDGGLAVLYGNIAADGCIVKTAGVDESNLKFSGPAVICESQEEAVEKILGGGGEGGRRGRDPLRRPHRRPRHAGNALSHQLLEEHGPRQGVRAHHRRALLRRHLRALHRPRFAGGGRGRSHRADRAGRYRRHRYSRPHHECAAERGRACRAPQGDGGAGAGGMEARRARASGEPSASGLRGDGDERRPWRCARCGPRPAVGKACDGRLEFSGKSLYQYM